MTVKNLSELLGPYLGSNKVIKDAKFTQLTKPGDNYGSLMLRLDLILFNNDTKEEEILHLVAKTLMESEEFREIFQVQTTYSNEIAFYNIIIPTLVNFQKEVGVENTIKCFPKCYGTRKNLLGDSDIIDDDAVLLLENLKISGYMNVDRTLGFDHETAKLVLKDTAQLHALCLALKLRKPDVFDAKVRPYCVDFPPPEQDKMRVYLKKLLEENETCKKLAPRVKIWGDTKKSAVREPFATVVHTDLWVNNTMQKFQDGKAVDNVLVDFQCYTYGSPASDVFFFLWTSVQHSVLEEHLDDLLRYYHEEFIKVLRSHGCDTNPFAYENFLDEIRMEANYEFPHALFFYTVIGCAGEMTREPESDEMITKNVSKMPIEFKKKFWYMVEECDKRGWLR